MLDTHVRAGRLCGGETQPMFQVIDVPSEQGKARGKACCKIQSKKKPREKKKKIMGRSRKIKCQKG